MLGSKRVFITHGHNYYVSLDPEMIKEEGRARKADIVMYGHTHKPYMDVQEDITVLNPGSLSYPRQEGRKGSFMILEMDENGNCDYKQLYIE